MSFPSGVRGRAPKALALFVFLEGKIQHLINTPAPNLLKLTSRKRDIHERKYVKCIGGHGTLQKYRGTGTRYFAKISTAVPVLSN